MGEDPEPLYDPALMRLMSEAYEAADRQLGKSIKAAQVAMALAIIRAINDGQRDRQKLIAAAVAAGRLEQVRGPQN